MSRCNKIVFKTAAEARRFTREKGSTWNGGLKGKMHPYECPYCGQYHLTSQTKKEQRRRQKKMGMR